MRESDPKTDFSEPWHAISFLEQASGNGTFGASLQVLSLEELRFLQSTMGSLMALHPEWEKLVPELLQAIETQSK